MPLGEKEIDKLFCMMSRKYQIKKLILKAIAICESSMDERSYRYEPDFWNKYLKNNPEWKDKDPAVVSASYGLMQLMWTTAWSLGFMGTQEDLYNPVYNIELGAKLMRRLIDKIQDDRIDRDISLWAIEIACARYNGGSAGNPSPDGKLRNQKYVNRVMKTWRELSAKEEECPDE